jgi:spermidine synthase
MNFAIALAVAALGGFVALCYEMVWFRVLAFLTWGTASCFGLLLGAYLLGIAIGARASAALCKRSTPTGDPTHMRWLAIFVAVANLIGALVVPVFAWSARFSDYRFGLVAVAVGACFLGSLLPLVSQFAIAPDDRAGQRLSWVYLANIVGSASGSLLTGLVLMDHLSTASLDGLLALSGLALVALLVVACRLSRRGATVAWLCLSAVALAGVPGLLRLHDRLYERLLYKSSYQGQRFAQLIENRSGVIAVTRDGVVYGGGAYDGKLNTSLIDDRNGINRAYAVGAMHPHPRDIMMIGLASGSWVQILAHLPGVERLTVVEINPGYVKLIERFPEVAGVLRNPRVNIVFDDARRWLQRNPDKRFDVIVMNTTWHWRAHITNLLSMEFMQLARAHLQPAGLFYFNTTTSDDAQKTAATAFPYALRVSNFIAVSDAPLNLDRERFASIAQNMIIEGKPALDLSRDSDRGVLHWLGNYDDVESRESVLARTAQARIITDDNMVPEWRQPLRYPDPE